MKARTPKIEKKFKCLEIPNALKLFGVYRKEQ